MEWLEEDCIKVKELEPIVTPSTATADQAQWSRCVRTADGNHSTGDSMQHTLGEWLKENSVSAFGLQRKWDDLRVCYLHWDTVHMDVHDYGAMAFTVY